MLTGSAFQPATREYDIAGVGAHVVGSTGQNHPHVAVPVAKKRNQHRSSSLSWVLDGA